MPVAELLVQVLQVHAVPVAAVVVDLRAGGAGEGEGAGAEDGRDPEGVRRLPAGHAGAAGDAPAGGDLAVRGHRDPADGVQRDARAHQRQEQGHGWHHRVRRVWGGVRA